MIAKSGLAPLLAAAISLAGALAATLYLHHAATEVVGSALDARLKAAGESAALFLAEQAPSDSVLGALARTHSLDGAYVLGPTLAMVADSAGTGGQQANLLRVDAARALAAFRGEPSVGTAFRLGELGIQTAYFPIRSPGHPVGSVLGLEAGEAFAAPAAGLLRARNGALALAAIGALALALVAARWSRFERERREAVARGLRAQAIEKLAAMAAHEIRNPLGIIRGTVELMRERTGDSLAPRDRSALADVLEEVQRLRRLTDDLLDLSADRPLLTESVDLGEVLTEAVAALTASHPQLSVRAEVGALPPVQGDPSRLRQVFLNLLVNAAQAQGSGEISVRAALEPRFIAVRVADQGPGIPVDRRDRLFEPFMTTKPTGAGLGLAISRRLVERHGGALELIPSARGATFEVRLPLQEHRG